MTCKPVALPARTLRRLTWAAVITPVVAVVCISAPRAGADELPAEVIARIDGVIERFRTDKHVPGISLAVVVDGKLAYEHGYGLADVENQVPATPQTVYRLASISKMLTGVAVMQLAEQGKLDLSAPIQRYVPEFPEKEGIVTAELLLKHQSGVRHYRGNEVRSAVHYANTADTLAIFKDDPLLFAPGEKYSYTTYGYSLLGRAIEVASGQDYASYVRDHVCKPAGMQSIQPDNLLKIIPHRAAGYRRGNFLEGSMILNAYPVDVSNKVPGGGWCSTAGDLARFAIALASDQLVAAPTRERMWVAQKTNDGTSTTSGLGCFVRENARGQVISHSGGQPKVSTFLMLEPDRRAAVALMCNLEGTPLQSLASGVLELIPSVPAPCVEQAKLDALVTPLVEGGWLYGAAIGLISERGRQTAGYGRISEVDPAPSGPDTLFEIGSITKVFTGLLLAQMADERLVALEDPVQRLLGDSMTVPRGEHEITLLDLTTHRSGLPRMPANIKPKDPANPYADYSVEQMAEFLAAYHLPRQPGERYEYSNLGVGLLGHALAKRDGTTYEAALVKRVCDPLGLRDTRIMLDESQKQRLASPHNASGRRIANWDIPTLAGAGALRSSSSDMLKFLAANIGLEKSSLDAPIAASHKAHFKDSDPQNDVALGWHVQHEPHMVWHNGATGGYHSMIAFWPEKRVGVVVLANSSSQFVDPLAVAILHLLATGEVKPIDLPQRPATPNQQNAEKKE